MSKRTVAEWKYDILRNALNAESAADFILGELFDHVADYDNVREELANALAAYSSIKKIER